MMNMKLHKTLMATGIVAAGLTGLMSCTDGYEPTPVENFTIDYVFSTTDSVGKQAINYLNNIYRHLSPGHNRVGADYLDAATDDATSLYYDESSVYKIATGRYTASVRVGDMDWDIYYQTIREATTFIANIDRVPFKQSLNYIKGDAEPDENGVYPTSPLNETMKAEARFLRALAYFDLVKRYGGVPLLGEKIFTLDDDLELPRNTFAECIDYIVDQLDIAKKDLRGLPMFTTDYEMAPTREACDAFKSRVLLYAASKLYNEQPLQQGNELIGYASYDANRWKLAADAAKNFIETYGHKGSGAINLTGDFRNIFLSLYDRANNPEVIWSIVQQHNGTSIEGNNGPLGFTGNASGQGRTNPSQNLVEAFPMKDGKAIRTSSKYSYSAETQYENRDPRLEMTVLHNGSRWMGRQLATYLGGSNNPKDASVYNRTSYYMCKFMRDYSSPASPEYQNSVHNWVMFRYAEILLNYAEAMNEYEGPNADGVRDCLIMLRQRAGIEAGDDNSYGIDANLSKEQMRELIYNERRIEMAFEEQRFNDLRRWRLAETALAQPVRGLDIVNNDGIFSYREVTVVNPNWDNRRYFYPIPYSEVLKNSNMVQNPNW
ncbi:MAG: RagB/SusD family nutrient uptake outer membrane protein [Muribaculaceae bacterium]|nr:RagB/SusD family nutrient uptake outer membrane protein [Muribaculaceae bacterium]